MIIANWGGAGTGNPLRMLPYTAEKVWVVSPTPRPMVSMAVRERRGVFKSIRTLKRRSVKNAVMMFTRYASFESVRRRWLLIRRRA